MPIKSSPLMAVHATGMPSILQDVRKILSLTERIAVVQDTAYAGQHLLAINFARLLYSSSGLDNVCRI